MMAVYYSVVCVKIMNPESSHRALTYPIKKALYIYRNTKVSQEVKLAKIQFLRHMIRNNVFNS